MKQSVLIFFFLFVQCAYADSKLDTLLEKSCRIEGYPFAIACGSFSVNDKWQGNQQPIQLKWYKVKSRAKYPQATPIIWMPELGTDATARAPSIISSLSRLRSHYDIIWLEVRASRPQDLTACLDKAVPSFSARIYRYADQPFLNQCQQQLNLLGGIHQFSNEKLAQDYEQLKKHLNIKQVIVLADGKSSAIALHWHRLYKGSIKAMVFDSPAQLTFNTEKSLSNKAKRVHEAIQASFTSCAKAVVCHQKYPNPEKDLQHIIQQLPIDASLKDPLTAQTVSITITHELFHSMLNNLIRSPSKTVLLPMLFADAAKGSWQAMIGVQSLSWSKRTSKFNYGLYLAQQCLSNRTNGSSLDASAHVQNTFEKWYMKSELEKLNSQCTALKGYQIAVDAPSQTDTLPPTLIFTGGLDPMRELPQNQNNGISFINVANAGAGIYNYPCTKDIVYRYIKLASKDKLKGLPMDQNEALCLAHIPYPSSTVLGALEGVEND